ncbi:tRNA (uracil-5-)-methyltransferase A [Echinococcus granulosus]|uniref:tRNA (uracil(54)-C(5))-methyltransferase n=1 Tax=Echinococcus granulosus TaxID=6210 RepID=W6UUC4_ECHGR|nr:tRNA (uracil-5-)-methyltransferase A [Echinococcus granulosus]EUB64266.1 tRNA (uracil-5-)-methyltransferase A [Echinococcus granulosus]
MAQSVWYRVKGQLANVCLTRVLLCALTVIIFLPLVHLIFRYLAPTRPGPVVGVRLGKYREGSTAVAYPALAPIFSATTRAAVASLQACLDAIYHQPHEKESAVLFDRVAARLSVYDAVTKTGNWCDFTVRESRLGDCLMEVRIQRGNLIDGDIADLEFILKQWFQPGGPGGSVGVTSFHLVVLTGDSQLIGPLTERCVFGKDTITELCCGLKFVIAKDAFFQVNTLATEKLYEEVRRRCKAILKGEDKPVHSAILLDICCGTGTIGLCLADCFEKVIGIELIPSAVENAKMNAKLNDITNAQFYAGKAELVLKDLMRDLPEDKEIIAVLDPPRAGVNLGVIEAIRRCERVQHLIFVACDLSRAVANFEAFARPPSRKYVGAPFFPTVASCIDLFPHTPGIEIVLSLKRLPSSDYYLTRSTGYRLKYSSDGWLFRRLELPRENRMTFGSLLLWLFSTRLITTFERDPAIEG